eukprot:CAMPEP_0203800102 /NCGR_PEP_ID=MMETSP0100_2-20121128/10326_1 /ASSEMBLY_ACC=CAM_ASM_000210 /TAXON_ID=96639 /ORGANISM=" , Strain NY0313808BC1" /LENGTH=205 /DNA_ID=CAMNT_0050706139 /DNA_START=147 /DNA_END=764 /DNA_ORIENTATION=+
MEEFDLYKGLHLTQKSCCKDRCRANYHRLAHRYHPKYGRKPSEELFNKVTLAYNVLRDEERREIYDTHGFSGLKKSEQYMDPNMFEIDPYECYSSFFSFEDSENKEYFMLNGTGAVCVTDSEGEEDDDADTGTKVDNDNDEEIPEEIPTIALSEADEKAAKELAEKAASLAFPTPPASVLVSNEIFSHKEGDIFAKIKGQVCAEQ